MALTIVGAFCFDQPPVYLWKNPRHAYPLFFQNFVWGLRWVEKISQEFSNENLYKNFWLE